MKILGRTKRAKDIRVHLLESIKNSQPNIVADASERFNVSRQTISRHLSFLAENEWVTSIGNTRNRVYQLGEKRFARKTYDLRTIKEDIVYRNDFSFIFENAPNNIDAICHYGFTEMLNNAIEHSDGTQVLINANTDGQVIQVTIHDDGEGIFKHIARIMGLDDPRESLLELSKGKLTTDPNNHTGEGIFFTSRAFQEFVIFSGDLSFNHHSEDEHDWLFHVQERTEGTFVGMRINISSTATLKMLFDEFSSGPDDYAFDKTIVPVQLALYEGDRLISRSQARRILNRVERFRYVILDFQGVDFIGQAFADEVFRVFALAHPEIEISSVNIVEDVSKMINRAIHNR
jgi:anti-sigma regulatory factor (Ser/Thr protein kinase)